MYYTQLKGLTYLQDSKAPYESKKIELFTMHF